jgi:hypothetical protein
VATIRIPRLVPKTNKSGVSTWYWQPSATLRKQGWQPRSLGQGGGPNDIPEHVADQARKLNQEVDGAAALAPRELRRIQRPLTVDEAFKKWEDAGFPSVKRPGAKVSDATARQYSSKGRTLKAWGKGVALTSITAERVGKLRDALMAQIDRDGDEYVRHHAAHETLRVGRTFFSWLERQHLVAKGSNPFADFALAAPPPRQQIWWQPHRDAILAAAAADGSAMELAVDLAFSIGQREADLLKLQLSQFVEIPHYKMDPEVWEQLAEATDAFDKRRVVAGIRIRQGKGSVWIEVPIVGATRARVEAQVAAAKTANTTSLLFDAGSGLPWTQPNLEAGQRRFIRRFAELRQAAVAAAAEQKDFAGELADLQFRDFRRTAVVFLGELGIADQLVAAITGHTLDETKKILETYMPRTTGMAARAIALSRARAPAQKEQVQ